MSDSESKGGAGCGATLIIFAMGVPLLLWNGFVISWAWTWFVVPLGAPPIGVAHAAGLVWLLALTRGVRASDVAHADTSTGANVTRMFASAVFSTLGFGACWVVSFWVPA